MCQISITQIQQYLCKVGEKRELMLTAVRNQQSGAYTYRNTHVH
jgi:hypothetical protein